ncbi:hypothetical protein Nepgr_032951 [Nepenthes gracilis]|uniref:Cytochrome P450 n=1 Tax=Nepenthes gracilis TaxID=150966 RepID=A0AAD3Y6I0_NEPGR|nr:hypothetical protein Nepgr_032951 [Nepenthes gracilis]
MRNLLFFPIQWTYSHLHFIDILLALLGLFIFCSIHQKLTSKGPMLWPILGILPTFLLHFHEVHEWNTRALIKSAGTYYYRGVTTGDFRGIITCDPINIEYMLKNRFHNFPKGKYYRDRFRDFLGDGIFNADGDIWKEQRRIATMEMQTSRFLEYSTKIMQELVQKKLLMLIEKKIESGDDHCIDLQEWLLRFTFDNICMAAFGVDPGCLALELPEIPFAKAFEQATEISLFRFLVPPFIWKPMKYFNLGSEKRLKEALRVVHDFAQSTVKNRKLDIAKSGDKKSNQNDLLSRLIKIQQDDESLQHGRKNHFSDKFLSDFCISLILAGRDTSSVALVWFFWLLNENPDVETKILSEIGEIVARRGAPRESNETLFTADELEKMVYLQAALSEAMRLYPPVPIDFKEVEEDDVYPDGMKTRKGDRVFYHIFAMGRMENIWGKDCHEFKPERWIKDGEFVSENQFKYVVFNAGPRLCVGKKFAFLQMKMLTASLLVRFKVKVAEDQVIVPKVTTTLYMKHGLLVTFHPRPDNIKVNK